MNNNIKLLEICNIVTGKLDSNASEKNGIYPYFTCGPVPLAINTYAFDDDAILLAGNNASGNFHCQRYKGKFNAYQRTYVITAKTGFDIDYIYYNLKFNLGYLKKISQGSQTKFLTMNILNEFQLKNLKYEDQKRMSKILSVLDKKIKLNNKINLELKNMAKTIYDYWFLQFEFPNDEGKPYKSSGGKMVWNEELKKEIPDGWEIKNIFEELCVQYGFPFSTESFTEEKTNIPVVRIRDILNNSISIYSSEVVDKKYLLKEADLLIGMDGNFHINYWADNISYLNQRSVRLRVKVESNVSIVQARFDIEPFIKAKEQRAKGSTVGHLSDKDLKELKVIVPKEKKLKITLDSLLNKIITNRKENQELISLRDYLLPLLMNGQIGFKD